MKTMFPAIPTIEVLNTQTDKNTTVRKLLLFTPLTEKEHDKFVDALTHYLTFPKLSPKRKDLDAQLEKIHKITFANIVAIGDTQMETRLANGYIEHISSNSNNVIKNNYKCFVNKDWKEPTNKMNLNYHDDGGCSWNCLMQKLKMPKYGIIYSIPIEDKFKFNINESL